MLSHLHLRSLATLACLALVLFLSDHKRLDLVTFHPSLFY